MIDVFASQYGWELEAVIKRTWHQLVRLRESMDERMCNERSMTASLVRSAHHANREEFERFIASLNPKNRSEM